MNILSKIFSSGASELVKNVGEVVDNLTTSDQERIEAKNKLEAVIMDYESKMQQEVTARWTQDMNSDSWLSKNIRPLTLIFLVVSTVVLIFIDAGVIDFNVEESWINLLQITLLTVIGAYFGGRSYEKVKRN
jgi:hypothetical protein|tara:strand:- start:358 stop:753 length:396 start_codon:yes stop_codon:yes gene_type:complete